MKMLTKEQIVRINKKMGEGGILLNEANLEHAISHAEGMKKPEEAAMDLMYSICATHPFLDGNKRTAIASFMEILMQNNLKLRPKIDARLERMALDMARGKTVTMKRINNLILWNTSQKRNLRRVLV